MFHFSIKGKAYFTVTSILRTLWCSKDVVCTMTLGIVSALELPAQASNNLKLPLKILKKKKKKTSNRLIMREAITYKEYWVKNKCVLVINQLPV